MTKQPQNVLPTNKEPLHSMEDKDFDQWLDTIPAVDTGSLITKYRKYAAETIAKAEDTMTFTDWRNQLERNSSNIVGPSR